MPCYFWKSERHHIPAFETNIVPAAPVTEQCRLLFNIKVSSLTNMDLFLTIGFHSIYGIVNKPDAGNDSLKVQQLERLNDLCTAETIGDKRQIFITHCKQFMDQYLTELDQDTLTKFKQVIDFCSDQIEQSFHTVMAKKKRKHAEDFIEIREAIARSVLVAVNMTAFITPAAGQHQLSVKDILLPFSRNPPEELSLKIQTIVDETQAKFEERKLNVRTR